MKFRSIKYYFEEALKSVIRNKLMSVTSILTVASCIFILIFSYCLAINIDYILEQFETSIPLSVIIDDASTTEQITELYDKIIAIEDVEDAKFVSAIEALKSFIDSVGNDSDILSGFEDDNPMPRSFTITLKNSKSQDKVVAELEKLTDSGVEKVLHRKKTISSLIAINSIVRVISIIIVLVLGMLSVIIIMNTIKLTVNNRRNDIGIMKYVGATDWFIKWPFIIEGVIIGIVGALIPVFIACFSYSGIIAAIESNINKISKLFDFRQSFDIFPTLIPAMLILGIFIGAIGSTLSMRKYLDV